jgi:hypothetical protein
MGHKPLVPKVVRYMTKYLHFFADLCLQDYSFHAWAPSLLAAAIVIAARKSLNIRPLWSSPAADSVLGYSFSDVAPVFEAVWEHYRLHFPREAGEAIANEERSDAEAKHETLVAQAAEFSPAASCNSSIGNSSGQLAAATDENDAMTGEAASLSFLTAASTSVSFLGGVVAGGGGAAGGGEGQSANAAHSFASPDAMGGSSSPPFSAAGTASTVSAPSARAVDESGSAENMSPGESWASPASAAVVSGSLFGDAAMSAPRQVSATGAGAAADVCGAAAAARTSRSGGARKALRFNSQNSVDDAAETAVRHGAACVSVELNQNGAKRPHVARTNDNCDVAMIGSILSPVHVDPRVTVPR